VLKPLLGRHTRKPAANPPNPPAQRPNPSPPSPPAASTLPLSLPGRARMAATASLSFLPLSPFAFPRRWSTVPHHAGARDGTAAPARRSARRGPVRERGVGFDRRGGKRPYYPLHRASEANPSAGLERHPPRPANDQGYGGHFHLGLLVASIQKDARPAWHGRQATNPPLGFSIRHRPCLRRLGRRRRRVATASRRAREEPGAGPEQEQLRR
jgi:hypothetical protein